VRKTSFVIKDLDNRFLILIYETYQQSSIGFGITLHLLRLQYSKYPPVIRIHLQIIDDHPKNNLPEKLLPSHICVLSVWADKSFPTNLHLTWYFLICESSDVTRSCLFLFSLAFTSHTFAIIGTVLHTSRCCIIRMQLQLSSDLL